MGYCYFNEDGQILYNSDKFGMTFWIDINNDFVIVQHLMITHQIKHNQVMYQNGLILKVLI